MPRRETYICDSTTCDVEAEMKGVWLPITWVTLSWSTGRSKEQPLGKFHSLECAIEALSKAYATAKANSSRTGGGQQ